MGLARHGAGFNFSLGVNVSAEHTRTTTSRAATLTRSSSMRVFVTGGTAPYRFAPPQRGNRKLARTAVWSVTDLSHIPAEFHDEIRAEAGQPCCEAPRTIRATGRNLQEPKRRGNGMSNRERTPVSVERANAETAAVATPEIPGGYPDLTASQLDLIRERSTETVVDPGASLANAGDVDFDFMLVEAGDLEVVRLAAFGLPEQVIAIFGPGSFLGELDMLTGQAAMFSARMPVGGVIQRMPRPVFRQLMSDAPELSDIILKAFMARREFLRTSEAARSCPDRRRRAVGRDAGAPQLGHAPKHAAHLARRRNRRRVPDPRSPSGSTSQTSRS